MRPKTLAEVARWTIESDSFDHSVKNFLDEFRINPSFDALSEEPPFLSEVVAEIGPVQDAHLAAVAETLAQDKHFPVPFWAFEEKRKLRKPWFALNYASIRALLLWERPPAFRSRNLFVSENALSRA